MLAGGYGQSFPPPRLGAYLDLQRIGKYDILEQIGEGAMGRICRAHDPVLKRDVAIKTLRGAIQGDATMA